MEYLIIIGILLVVLTPIFIFSLNSISINVQFNEANEAVDKIATSADNLHKLGGGKQTISVNMPSGISSSQVGNNAILLRVTVSDSTGDVVAFTDANVNGTISTSEGLQQITLEVIGNTVQIS